MTKFDELIDHFGSKSAIADVLGVTRPAVSQWLEAQAIPPYRAIQIEQLTHGRFKAKDLIGGE